MEKRLISIISWRIWFVVCLILCTACFDDWLSEDESLGDNVRDMELVACDSDGGVSESLGIECRVLELVNQQRAAGGDCREGGSFGPSSPLVMNSALLTAAREHSQDMAERDYFDHDSPGGPNGDNLEERLEEAGYTGWSSVGENIAAGDAEPDAVMRNWMASDFHCANILNPKFEEIGIGYAQVVGSTYTHYWTQDFGTPW